MSSQNQAAQPCSMFILPVKSNQATKTEGTYKQGFIEAPIFTLSASPVLGRLSSGLGATYSMARLEAISEALVLDHKPRCR